MPTPTYDLISSQTLTTTASTVTFSSIPATYRDLVLTINVLGTSTSVNTMYARLNSDSGNNYNSISMYATTAGGTGSASGSNQTELNISDRSNAGFSDTKRAFYVVQFMDYSATDKHKGVFQRANAQDGEVVMQFHRWASTSAINQIVLTPYAGGFAATSVFSLYGIAS